jgi:hypothetical protein
MHEDLVQFFKMESGLVACNATDGLVQTLNITFILTSITGNIAESMYHTV